MKIEFEAHVHQYFHLASVETKAIQKQLASLLINQGKIMSAISDFATAQTEHNARMDSALSGINDDITALNAKITELQNSPGAITAADQVLLDDLQAQAEALATRIEATDAITPPAVPVPPPVV